MLWSDIEDIVKMLQENYPEEEIKHIRLIDLADLVVTLEDFADDPEGAEEETLLYIKETWLILRAR